MIFVVDRYWKSFASKKDGHREFINLGTSWLEDEKNAS